MNELCFVNADDHEADFECKPEHAFVTQVVMIEMQDRKVKTVLNQCHVKHESFNQCTIKAAIEKFENAGKMAEVQEFEQSHDRKVFTLINVKNSSKKERKRASESLVFIKEKRDGQLKKRTCANGSKQRK